MPAMMSTFWVVATLCLALFGWKVVASFPDLVAWFQLERLPHAPRNLITGHWQPGGVMKNPHLRWFQWHKELGGLFCSRLLWRHVRLAVSHAWCILQALQPLLLSCMSSGTRNSRCRHICV